MPRHFRPSNPAFPIHLEVPLPANHHDLPHLEIPGSDLDGEKLAGRIVAGHAVARDPAEAGRGVGLAGEPRFQLGRGLFRVPNVPERLFRCRRFEERLHHGLDLQNQALGGERWSRIGVLRHGTEREKIHRRCLRGVRCHPPGEKSQHDQRRHREAEQELQVTAGLGPVIFVPALLDFLQILGIVSGGRG